MRIQTTFPSRNCKRVIGKLPLHIHPLNRAEDTRYSLHRYPLTLWQACARYWIEFCIAFCLNDIWLLGISYEKCAAFDKTNTENKPEGCWSIAAYEFTEIALPPCHSVASPCSSFTNFSSFSIHFPSWKPPAHTYTSKHMDWRIKFSYQLHSHPWFGSQC